MSNSIFQIEKKENYLLLSALQEELSISTNDLGSVINLIDNQSLINLMFDFKKVISCDVSILDFLKKANEVIIKKDGFIVVCNVTDSVKEQIESIESPQEIHASYTFSEAEDYLYMVELEKELGGLDKDIIE